MIIACIIPHEGFLIIVCIIPHEGFLIIVCIISLAWVMSLKAWRQS